MDDKRAGWPVKLWIRSVGIGATNFHMKVMGSADEPRHVRLGRRLIIIEQPADWLERMAKKQADAGE